MLKFYPIVLLVLAVRERAVMCLAIWAVALGVIALWFALDGAEILRGMANIPSTHRSMTTCSARTILPFGLAEVVGLPRAGRCVLQVLLLVVVLGVAACAGASACRLHALTEAEASLPAGRQRSAGELLRAGAERVISRDTTFCSCCPRWSCPGAARHGWSCC